jgi:hypothetical protein
VSSIEWKEKAYDDAYSKTLVSLARKRSEDAAYSLDDARGVLKHLYIQDGNDWVGRGELQDIVMQATIDAYERFIAEWESARSR